MENHVEEHQSATGRTGESGAAPAPEGTPAVEQVPQEVALALPSDPFELLRISRAIALQAYASRVERLEGENGELKGSGSAVKALEDKVAELQSSLDDALEKLKKSQEDQAKLANEKTALVAMVKKLNRDVAKLETFKRTLMQQLQDEGDDGGDASGGAAAAASDKSASAASGSASSTSSAKSSALTDGAAGASGAGTALRMAQAAKTTSGGVYGTPSVASQVAAAALDSSSSSGAASTPSAPAQSAADAPTVSAAEESDSDAGVSRSLRPIKTTSHRTPLTPSIFSPAYTPSATPPHSSTAASPRTGKPRAPRVDGKEFFRLARSRLSYEQFSTFLANIKELNAHRQTREETLKKADDIFGSDNKDLYSQFESLLSRHLPS